MANAVVYVDSGAGGSNNGTSWVNAYTTLAAAITASGTTGTDFYINGARPHAESGGSLTFTFKGAAATPDRVFSCGVANSPPTTADLLAGAGFSTTTSGAINLNGYVYAYGCTFAAGAGASSAAVNVAATATSDITLDTCKLQHGGTGTTSTFSMGSPGNYCPRVKLINTTMKFAATQGNINLNSCYFRWFNTASAVDVAGTLPTALFGLNATNKFSVALLDGVDLSGLTNKAIVAAILTGGIYQLVNCKLPTGFTMGVPAQPGSVVTDFVITDSAATTYKQSRYASQGVLTTSTAVYNNATDGVTPYSWQVVATATCNPQSPFECIDIVQWVPAGTYAASTVSLTSATASLTNTDAWVETKYLGASYTLASKVTTGFASQLPQGSSASSLASGSWATGGLGHNYSLAIPSFTTSVDGDVRFRIFIGKASLTANIDPAVTVA